MAYKLTLISTPDLDFLADLKLKIGNPDKKTEYTADAYIFKQELEKGFLDFGPCKLRSEYENEYAPESSPELYMLKFETEHYDDIDKYIFHIDRKSHDERVLLDFYIDDDKGNRSYIRCEFDSYYHEHYVYTQPMKDFVILYLLLEKKFSNSTVYNLKKIIDDEIKNESENNNQEEIKMEEKKSNEKSGKKTRSYVNPKLVKCDKCGKEFEMAYGTYRYNINKNKKLICKECKGTKDRIYDINQEEKDINKQLRIDIGKRVREERKKKHKTLDDMAQILCMTKSGLGLVEQGKNGLALSKLVRASEYFDISIDYLITGKDFVRPDDRTIKEPEEDEDGFIEYNMDEYRKDNSEMISDKDTDEESKPDPMDYDDLIDDIKIDIDKLKLDMIEMYGVDKDFRDSLSEKYDNLECRVKAIEEKISQVIGISNQFKSALPALATLSNGVSNIETCFNDLKGLTHRSLSDIYERIKALEDHTGLKNRGEIKDGYIW